MTMKRVLGATAGLVLLAVTGVAVAANFTSSQPADFFAPGKHQFYVWCAVGGDFTTYEVGTSAEDAQMKLYEGNKAKGRSTCWPVWQGKVSG
jgi:hypothetical protein